MKTFECEVDTIEFYFIELPKLKLNLGQLASHVDAWCFFFLKNIHFIDQVSINILEQKYPFLERAIKELNYYNLTPDERTSYLLHLHQGVPYLQSAEKCCENLVRARQAAEQEKLAAEQKIIDLAKKMFRRGIPPEEICTDTGLQKEDFM